MLVLLTVCLFGALAIAVAQVGPFLTPLPPKPGMPTITIGSDGVITPAGAPIQKIGNVYSLTNNLTDRCLLIECDGVTFDGAGYTVQSNIAIPDSVYLPSTGITVNANDVTVKDTVVYHHDYGIEVCGSHDTITECTIADSANGEILKTGIALNSNYDAVIDNALNYCGIYLSGDYNIIERNIMVGSCGITVSSSPAVGSLPPTGCFNTIAANTLQDCIYYAASPSTGTNVFYLNNFVNNTPANIAPYKFQLVDDGKVISMAQWVPGSTWMGIYSNNTLFDNAGVGNYWSDYNGTAAIGGNVGSTPYVIGGALRDNYPLMSPVDISKVNIPAYQWGTGQNSNGSEQQTEVMLAVLAIAATTLIVGATVITVLKKRRMKTQTFR
jgi:hypothetical protein